MELVGAAAFLDALEDMKDAYSGGNGWVVGTNVPYSLPQEFGTYKMEGTPHVRPGIDRTRAEMGRLAVKADDMDEFLKLTAFHLEGEIKELAPHDTGHLEGSYEAEPL